jgi:hypothetical protein
MCFSHSVPLQAVVSGGGWPLRLRSRGTTALLVGIPYDLHIISLFWFFLINKHLKIR